MWFLLWNILFLEIFLHLPRIFSPSTGVIETHRIFSSTPIYIESKMNLDAMDECLFDNLRLQYIIPCSLCSLTDFTFSLLLRERDISGAFCPEGPVAVLNWELLPVRWLAHYSTLQ